LCVRYIPDILNGTSVEAIFPAKAEFGDDSRLWSQPKILDKGNFSNAKIRIYPLLQTLRSTHVLPDNALCRVHVIIKMQFLEFSYSNEKVEIKRIGSLDLYEYEYEHDIDEIERYENSYENTTYGDEIDTIGTVNHLQLCLWFVIYML